MYDDILLTLDGSALAEKAVPHAVAMAQTFGSRLHLLRVVPLVRDATGPEASLALRWEVDTQEAREYLESAAAQLAASNLQTTLRVRHGDVAEEVLRQAAELSVDLIIMSTHGRSGLGRWVYGSVADRVLRHAEVPVLLVRAGE